jgi:glycerophosphoryl diester phosphodiesterase
MEQVHVWEGEDEVLFERVSERYSLLRGPPGPGAAQALASARAFIEATFPVHYYLLKKNAYFPPVAAGAPGHVLPPVTTPLFAAHRGNLHGPQAEGLENSRATLDQALASPVAWMEIDVQITADEIPVLIHDDAVLVNGQAVLISDLTLEQLRSLPGREATLTLEQALAEYLPRKHLLIEAKPQVRFQISSQLSRAMVALLRQHQGQGRFIVDSFDEFLAMSIKQQCDCEVGLDTPFQKALTPADLDHFRQLGVDWIYVEQSVVVADLIRAAHARGLKVMAYTVNEKATLDNWRQHGELPDGVITDYESISRGR